MTNRRKFIKRMFALAAVSALPVEAKRWSRSWSLVGGPRNYIDADGPYTNRFRYPELTRAAMYETFSGLSFGNQEPTLIILGDNHIPFWARLWEETSEQGRFYIRGSGSLGHPDMRVFMGAGVYPAKWLPDREPFMTKLPRPKMNESWFINERDPNDYRLNGILETP